MATKEDLLSSIQKGIQLNQSFFLKVYGYEISHPGFSNAAIRKLELCGCTQARSYYEKVVSTYEDRLLNGYTDADGYYHGGIKSVSEWFSKECDRRYDIFKRSNDRRVVEDWEQKKERDRVNNWNQLSNLLGYQ